MMLHKGVTVMLVVLSMAPVGCYRVAWEASAKARAPEYAVAQALGDTGRGRADISAASVPIIDPPTTLRPCCAFGADLKVAVGRMPIPGIEIGNVTGKDKLGPHRFNNGLVSLDPTDSRAWVDTEGNGIVYTCRGGFLDTAHVRDNADTTLACASAIGRLMDTGGSFELPSQGAKIQARIKAMDPAMLERCGRRQLTIPMAEWLDFQISIWHEIATWYGFASLADWPEKISAFSPEDLYSNLIGARIAGGIIEERGASSTDEYNHSMDAWIQQVGQRLKAVPMDQSRAAMQSVDGIWWDSNKRIPDWQLILRRNFNIGPDVSPWLVANANPPPPLDRQFKGCESPPDPVIIHVADGFEGIRFHDYLTLEIEVDDKLAANGFPFPRADSRLITQEDFPFIIDAIRRESVAAFGAPSDAP
jgi:hypothetical protein